MWWLALVFAVHSPDIRFVSVAPAESLRVTLAGAGHPVVLVPSLFGSAFAYRQVIPLLTGAGYRSVVIEPLAVGSSGRPARADYSFTAQARRIAAVLDTLGVTDAVIVAHATAGSIALRLAYLRPDLVAGVVSLEGGVAESPVTPSFRRAMQLIPWIKWFGGIGLVRRKIRRSLIAASADTTWVTDEVVNGYTQGAAADLDGTLRALLAMGRAREPQRLSAQLARVRCPVRLLLGGHPHANGPRAQELRLLADSLPWFAVDTLPGVGHFIYEERPAAVVQAVVAATAARRVAHLPAP